MRAAPLSEHLVISSRLERIDEARRWAASLAREAWLDERAVFELELAMTEALSNVIRHAYRGDAAGTIELALTIDERRLELLVLDRGRPFDPASHRCPDPDTAREGQYGLQLIGELVDEARFTPRRGGGTALSLVKHRQGEGDG